VAQIELQTTATVHVMLYCTWHLSDQTTGLCGQASIECYFVWFTSVVFLCCLNVFCMLVADPLSSWSADECANFVSGLRQYGKDFYQIHQNKVLTILHTFMCLTGDKRFTV